jgi:hypothetical protein
MGVGGQCNKPAALPPGTDPVPSPRAGLEGMEKLAPNGIQFLDCPALLHNYTSEHCITVLL